MKSIAYLLAALAVIGLAYWAYRENYETQAAIDHAEDLQDSIGRARSRLAMLKAEWAYLNRPDRLEELAAMNFERLGLIPLSAISFGKAEQVEYPPAPSAAPVEINDPVEVSSFGADPLPEVSEEPLVDDEISRPEEVEE